VKDNSGRNPAPEQRAMPSRAECQRYRQIHLGDDAVNRGQFTFLGSALLTSHHEKGNPGKRSRVI
jgi:hypothetical protein